MAVYNLTGSGTIGLTAGTTRILVDVQTFASTRSIGRATPPNYYDLGLLRFGVQGSYGLTYPIDSASMFLDCPDGVTTLGYSLFGTTAVKVTEQFASVSNTTLQPWDRNPSVVAVASQANIAPGAANVTLWTYTVPTGKILRITALDCMGIPYTTPAQQNGAGFTYITINGTQAQLSWGVSGGFVAKPVDMAFGPWDLPAGTVIEATGSNSLTDAVVFVNAHLNGYTFDVGD